MEVGWTALDIAPRIAVIEKPARSLSTQTFPREHDPRLVAHFALFRDPDSARGPVNVHDAAAIDRLVRRTGAAKVGLIASHTKKVVLGPSLSVLVVPGSTGVLLLTADRDGSFTTGFGAKTEQLLEDRPVGSSGPLLYGLAPDGITKQSVSLQDGSVIEAQVAHNVYIVEDQSWTAPVFAED